MKSKEGKNLLPSSWQSQTTKLPSAHPAHIAMPPLMDIAERHPTDESASKSSASGSRLIDTASPLSTRTDHTFTVASQLPLTMM
jgi:hypothetical protein